MSSAIVFDQKDYDDDVAHVISNSLTFCLTHLRIIAGTNGHDLLCSTQNSSVNTSKSEKLSALLEYHIILLQSQILSASHVTTLQRSFSPQSLKFIVSETLLLSEQLIPLDSYVNSHNPVPLDTLYSLQTHCINRFFTLFNNVKKTHADFHALWDGLTNAIEKTRINPIHCWIPTICTTVASVEHMALLVERCLDQSLISFHSYVHEENWKQRMSALEIPDLEEEAFMKQCIEHGLILTLYVCALQKLDRCTPVDGAGVIQETHNVHDDMKIVIGEGIGMWITALKLEGVKEGHEEKVYLLLSLYSE